MNNSGNNNKIYLATALGFSETGKHVLDDIIPKLERIGLTVVDPNKEFEENSNDKITPSNNEKMRESICMGAIFDGCRSIDENRICSQIGFYSGIVRGPIFALMSDIRYRENVSGLIDHYVQGCILRSGGSLAIPPHALDNWLVAINEWYAQFKKKII